ncbi:Endonuclease/exonuclease/phosphatase, partial [Hygrophoropsis aurantiaca]
MRRAGCERFVIFNTRNLGIPEIWQELKAFLNPEMFKGIKSLKKINPKNRPVRIDMYVSAEVASGLKRTIRSMTENRTPKFVRATKSWADATAEWRSRPLSLWRIDLWKAWRDRPSAPAPELPDLTSWRDHFATLNINGLASKKFDLEHMLEEEQISVCALQETLVSSRAYPVQMEGYTTYNQYWGDGFRGQTLLVRNHLSSYEVGREDKLYIHIKVSGLPDVHQPVHIIAVYLPSGGNCRRERTECIRKLLALNRKILNNTPGAPVIFLGDWNEEPRLLSEKLRTEESGLRRYVPVGSPLTRFPTRNDPAAIDHMVVSAGAYAMMRRPRVNRQYGMSDHRPLIAALRAVKKDMPQAPRWGYDSYAIKRYARELIHSNRWSLLEVEEASDGDELNESTTRFIGTMDEVSKSLGIKKQRFRGVPDFPRKLKALLLRRNAQAKRFAEVVLKGNEPSEGLKKKFKAAQKKFSKARDLWNLKNESKIIEYTCRDIQACDYKKVWTRLKRKVQHDGASEALQPVRNKEGVLCVSSEDILEAIADHYDRLANENPGPSQDSEHW